MKRRAFRYLLAAFVLAAFAAGIFVVVWFRPIAVKVAASEPNVPVQVFGLGTIEARILSRIGFEAGATLVELDADQGDLVKRGDVLARLHSAEQETRVAKALAGILIAEASVSMADAAVAKARAVLEQKKQTDRRKQELLARGTVAAEVAETAQMEEAVAAAELAVARSDVEVARAARADAQAQADYETVLLDQHVLLAPYDAIVVERHKEVGSVLATGEPLFTLIAPETVWVRAYVDEARAGGIRVGQKAEVRLRSLPRETFQGHVVRIDIESDRVTEERRVHIACDRCPESFHLGEQAEVLVTTTVLDAAVLVPETAVEGFDGSKGVVWTVEGGVLRRRAVEFGNRTLDGRLELADGLPAGARVVIEMRPDLREGRAATMVENRPP